MPSSTVEQNLKNLNINNFDLEFDVDPLFRKAAAELDEGGTESLLIHTLPIRGMTCELLLDSNMVSEDLVIPENGSQAYGCVNAEEIAEWSSRIDWNSLHICPSLSEFKFTETDELGNEGVLSVAVDGERTLMAPPVHSEYSCVIPESMDEACGYDNDCFGLDNASGYDQTGVEDDFHIHDNTRIGPVGDTGMTCYPSDQLVPATAQHTVNSLQLTDALQPSEYSYFNMDLISTWAGPAHWKIKRPLKKADGGVKTSLTEKKKTSRGQKKVFSLEFTAQVDFEETFRKTRAATTLSRAQLTKQEKECNLLPNDCHYETNNLFRTFLRLNVLVRRQPTQKHQSQDKQDDWYDYNNPNDSINYCPDIEVDGGCDNDIGFSQEHTVVAAAADLTVRPPSGLSQDQSCFKGPSMACNAVGEQSYLLQENMVALPQKVQKININFSKTTRKMDIKRLKSTMWNLITGNRTPRGQEKENQPTIIEDDGSDVSKAKRRCITSFSSLYRELPGHISISMSENLSVPISLICLLHLANEHGLQLTSSEKMDEVIVLQPTKPEE
jgi:condensin complex subunit 2